MLRCLIASALMAAMAGTAMAQAPERCNDLTVLSYDWDRNPYNGALTLLTSIRNDDQSRLRSASFEFEFLADEDVKLGQSSATIVDLGPGQTYKVSVPTFLRDFKSIAAHPLNCYFEH